MPAALEPWLQNAIDQFDKGAFKDGDMLSHDWVRWALQIPAASTVSDVTEIQFMVLQRFDAFRDYMLVTRKVALQSVWGKGYWIVPPGEQARVATEEAWKLIRRGLEIGDKILTHARIVDMDATEAKRHTDVHVKMSGLKAMARRTRRDVFSTFKPAKIPTSV